MTAKYDIHHIYFATNWINKTQSDAFTKSTSYKKQNPDLDAAVGLVLSELCPVQLEILDPNAQDKSGISGILEKIICIKASHFVGLMGPDLCARLSLYTEEIVEERRKLGKAHSNHHYL